MGKMDALFDGSDAHEIDQSTADDINADLLGELKKAHAIIRNALNVMPMDVKMRWASLNNAQGLVDYGSTRANEREAVITKAECDKNRPSEVLSALSRLLAQCDRLRLPGQPESDAEKFARQFVTPEV